ncbi:hypothetical protein ACFVFD_13935 [Streptomyces fimicarius]|uniref:hypothetical protein n=1 Tax=Streptomyces griseus TaxID=1911 RepID=UPI00367E208B
MRPADPANPRCVRSLGNYPNVAADVLGAELTDVTCSGATARDFTRSAHAGTPPQYDALSADTDLVSFTIGANDAELFRLPNTCVNLLPEPLGTSCEATITGPGTDRYAAARHGALYTDTAGISAGHDACAPPADRHIQSALSLRDGFPLHPTAAGSRAFGAAVAATLTDD